MATFLDPGNPENYTIGGTTFGFKGVDLGNIVESTVTPEIEDASFYNASLGAEAPDAFYSGEDVAVVQRARLTVDVILDELTPAGLRLFFGGADDESTDLLVFTRQVISGPATLGGVSDYGMEFTWAPPKCVLKTSGGLTYGTDDWITLPFTLTVYPDVDSPDAPFGVMQLLGLNEE